MSNVKRNIGYLITSIILLAGILPLASLDAKEKISLDDFVKELQSQQFTDSTSISDPISKYYLVRLNMDTIPSTFDTVTVLYNQYIEILDYLNDEDVPVRYIAPNPHFYRLTVPLAYYNSPVKRLGMPKLEPYPFIKEENKVDSLLPINNNYFTQVDRYNKLVDHTLMAMYTSDFSKVYTTEDKIMGHELFIDQILDEENRVPKKKISPFFAAEESLFSDLTMVDNKLKRPNWWHTGGEGSLQITQNYFSPNWYKGGESNNSVLGNIRLFANYDDRKKVQIESLFEAKLGFNTVPSDTLRSYRVNSDLIRFSTKMGIRATKKWFYTISGEMSTQFSRNFKKNSKELMSAFMTPFNFNFSIGMDYKEQREKVNFSIILAPGSYNFKYLRNDKVNPSNYGVKEGKKTLHEIGSKVDANIEWKIISSVRFQSKFSYFTNYSKVVAEWEGTFDFVLNRYLSTKLFFHARFDDAATRIDGKSYFQFKELLSFGINYRW